MKSVTYPLTFEQAEAMLVLRDELTQGEQHTLFCKDELGRFRVSFSGSENLLTMTVEQPYVVLYFQTEEGQEVLLETTTECSIDRAYQEIIKFLMSRIG